MTVKEGYQRRYRSGNAPWDTGRPDFNLQKLVKDFPIQACRALDIGCGTGDNAIWLARNGFGVAGIDASDAALNKAREKAAAAGVSCGFQIMDFFTGDVPGRPFGFVFDRGCFHSYSSDGDRKKFADKAAGHLLESGLWLTIAGSADEIRDRPGPPQLTASEIVLSVEPFFEIILLESTHFESNSPTPPRAWRCLMKKRPGLG